MLLEILASKGAADTTDDSEKSQAREQDYLLLQESFERVMQEPNAVLGSQ